MNTNTAITPILSRLARLTALGAAALVAAGSLAACSPADPVPTEAVSPPEAAAEPTANSPVADTPTLDAESAARTCYAGSVDPPTTEADTNAENGDGTEGPIVVEAFVEGDAEEIRIGMRVGIGDDTEMQELTGSLDAEGRFDGIARSDWYDDSTADTLIVTPEALRDTEESWIEIPAVDCDDVADEMAAIDDALARLDDSGGDAVARLDDSGGDPEAASDFTVEDGDAGVWTVTAETPVSIYATPFGENEIAADIAPGRRLGGIGSVATTFPDQTEWVAVLVNPGLAGRSGETTEVGWIEVRHLTRTEWKDLQCFAAFDDPTTELATSVLALNYDNPLGGDSPFGAVVTIVAADEDPVVELLALAPHPNPTETGDDLPLFVQNGDDWDTQMWVTTSFGVIAVDRMWESIGCDQVGAELGLIEGFGTDIPLPGLS